MHKKTFQLLQDPLLLFASDSDLTVFLVQNGNRTTEIQRTADLWLLAGVALAVRTGPVNRGVCHVKALRWWGGRGFYM